MARRIVSGSVSTQLRFTREEAIQILIDAATEKGIEFELPDFGEGETDELYVQFRGTDSNVNEGNLDVGSELVLVLFDNENDPLVEPDPEAEE